MSLRQTLRTFCFLIVLCSMSSNDMMANIPQQGMFIPNMGQWPSSVHYMAKTPSMNLWITEKGVIHDLYTVSNNAHGLKTKSGHAFEMSMKGALIPKGFGEVQSPTIVNYFRGKHSNEWKVNIPTYSTIRIPQVYDGIDLVYSFDGANPRYDFHVQPGVDPSKIIVNFNGAEASTTKEGTLSINTRFGAIEHGKIHAFQYDASGAKITVPCSFKKSQKGFTFTLAAYDKSKTLIIDPLVYSTYLGNAGNDAINGVALDNAGNVVSAGTTDSEDLPVITGSYDTQFNGGLDGVIIRYSPQLQTILSLTYIGGGGDDIINAVAIDFNGGIFVGGETGSSNFPLSTSWRDAYKAGVDGFVAKISSNGSQLMYSSYIPGALDERVLAIAAKPTGELLVGGVTNSTDFHTENGAYQRLKKALTDGFMMEFRPSGSLLNFSSYIGGDGDDRVTGVGYDPSFGAIFIAGTTGQGIANGPYPTPGSWPNQVPSRRPWDNTFNQKDDGFVAKFNKDGTHSDQNTQFLGYLGGNGNDRITGLTPLDDGTVIVCGETDFGTGVTTSFPIVGTTTTSKGGFDMFAARISSNGRTLLNSGVYGTQSSESATAVDFIPGTSQILLCGWTSSKDFSSNNIGNKNPDGGYGGGPKDGVVMKLTNDLSEVIYSSYYGGTGEDIVKAIVETSRGDFFFGGVTTSPDLATFQETNNTVQGTGTNGFIAKYAFGNLSLSSPSAFTTVCPGGNMNFAWTKEGLTASELVSIQLSSDGGNTWNTVAKDLAGSNFAWKIPDDYVGGTLYRARVINVASGLRDISDTTFRIGESTVITEQPIGDSLCPGSQFRLIVKGNGKGTYEWRFKGTLIQGARDSILTIPSVKASDAGDYVATVNTGCRATQSLPARLFVKPTTRVTTEPQGVSITSGSPLQLRVVAEGTKLEYQWYVDGAKINNATDSVYRLPSTNTGNSGDYFVIVSGECGIDTSAIAKVVVSPPSSVSESIKEQSQDIQIKVYGNDANDMYVTVNSLKSGMATVSLMSNTGELIQTLHSGMMNASEVHEYRLPTGLASGSYWINVKIGGIFNSKQCIIKQ